MLSYHLSIAQPTQRLLQIQIGSTFSPGRNVLFRLPYWRPGRYERQYYSRNILKVKAQTSEGQLLKVEKSDELTWKISTESLKSETQIQFFYQYYCQQLDAGGSYLSEDLFYINPVNCCMVPDGADSDPVELNLTLPDDYIVACGLPLTKPNHFKAEDIRHLWDSPIIASRYLQIDSIEVSGIPFHFCSYGLGKEWPSVWSQDLANVAIVQRHIFKGVPFQSFYFLFLFTKSPHYHGVEHKSSTVIVLQAPQTVQDAVFIDTLYGICAHELFHAWNICTIKPNKLVNWDYTKPCYFNTGYVAEGFTTYYGDLTLLRSGVWTVEQFFQAFGENFIRHAENPAKHEVSLIESSLDLWSDGYQPTHPLRKVSIYDKGALVAFILDITIREDTNHSLSLDHMLADLWQDSQKSNYKGYEHVDIIHWITKNTRLSGEDFSKKYIEGTIPLEQTLARVLDLIGVVIEYSPNPIVWERKFGIKLQPTADGLVVKQLAIGSSAEKHLNKGDKIQQIFNQPALEAWMQVPQEATMLHLGVHTPFGIRQVSIVAHSDGYFAAKKLKSVEVLSQKQQIFRSKWLREKA